MQFMHCCLHGELEKESKKMEALKFTQLEYFGAFSFAAGLALFFVGLYVSSVKARIKDLLDYTEKQSKAFNEREEKAVKVELELVGAIKKQTEVINRFMNLEETVSDLTRRVIKIEP